MTTPSLAAQINEQIKAQIKSVHYFDGTAGVCGNAALIGDSVYDTVIDANNEHLYMTMFCIIVLKNGFRAVGVANALSKQTFSVEVGRQEAYKKAFNELWPVFAYIAKSEESVIVE